ncbi:Uncharacterised protein [Mycobacteroides abscessus subsp. bolletii]|nr:Uncharacterised protein [Mycobacteroides abscessus subsp. bolletii]
MMTVFCLLLVVAVLWLMADNGSLRSDNTELRRKVAHLTGHPSTLPSGVSVVPGGKNPKWAKGIEDSVPPYMRTRADDE